MLTLEDKQTRQQTSVRKLLLYRANPVKFLLSIQIRWLWIRLGLTTPLDPRLISREEDRCALVGGMRSTECHLTVWMHYHWTNRSWAPWTRG